MSDLKTQAERWLQVLRGTDGLFEHELLDEQYVVDRLAVHIENERGTYEMEEVETLAFAVVQLVKEQSA